MSLKLAPLVVLILASGLLLDNPALWEPPEPLAIVEPTQTPLPSPTELPTATATTTSAPTHTPAPPASTATPIPPRTPYPPRPAQTDQAIWDHLARIRGCESGHNYGVVSRNGLFFGAYQFMLATWQGVGGTGYPHQASPAEQDARAYILYTTSNPYTQWPHCAYR